MDKLRILWLESTECVLFNSFDKRVSGRCPEFVGRVAERVSAGEDFGIALSAEGVSDADLQARTRAIIEYVRGESTALPYPIGVNDRTFAETLVLCPTSECNLRCLYCSGAAGDRGSRRMHWELAKKAIEFFFDHTVSRGPYLLQFHGAGEPMTNFEVVRRSVVYAREIGKRHGERVFVRTTTNGVLAEARARWVAENFDHVNLSLDGPREIHDYHRPTLSGAGSYEKVLRTLRLLEETGALGHINTVVTEHSVHRMEEILHHIRSVSLAEELRLLPMSHCGRCDVSGLEELDTVLFERRLQQIRPTARALGFKLLSYLEQMDYFTEYYCGACGFNMCVTPNGTISTCVEVMDEEDAGANDMIVGHYDVVAGTFRVEWDKVRRLRTRTYKSLPGCRECTFRTNCSGYCLVRAARRNGTVMSVDPDSCATVKSVLSSCIRGMADGADSNLGAPQSGQ